MKTIMEKQFLKKIALVLIVVCGGIFSDLKSQIVVADNDRNNLWNNVWLGDAGLENYERDGFDEQEIRRHFNGYSENQGRVGGEHALQDRENIEASKLFTDFIYAYYWKFDESEKNVARLQRAVALGHPIARFELAKLYYIGTGVALDRGKAKELVSENQSALTGIANRKPENEFIVVRHLTADNPPYADIEIVHAKYLLGYLYARTLFTNIFGSDQSLSIQWYEQAAEYRYAPALHNLARLYQAGSHVERDYSKASDLYGRADRQGYVVSKTAIGIMLENGQGGEQDFDLAALTYTHAAALGEYSAMYRMGLMYRNGKGVRKDDKKAADWYRRAAKRNYAPAQASLGWMYANGVGVAKDEREAVRLYKLAAAKENIVALNNLGFMYERGIGVAQNRNKAVRLYRLAARQGNEIAQKNLQKMGESW
ncbi:MAG: sel1 repeat family protein [Cryomorphaceae bacterium]|nr:sel1 repeat family protein [Cryomorphaceae bacterium]